MTKRTLPPFVGEAQAKLDKIESDYKAAKIEAAMQQPGMGDTIHKLGADAIEAVLAAQQEAITMSDTLREAIAKSIANPIELPDNIRVPLHELRADTNYLFGRVAADGSVAGMMADSVITRLSQIETAVYYLVAERDALKARVEKLEKALKPFADAVYNDNGDVTIERSHIRIEHYLAARQALET